SQLKEQRSLVAEQKPSWPFDPLIRGGNRGTPEPVSQRQRQSLPPLPAVARGSCGEPQLVLVFPSANLPPQSTSVHRSDHLPPAIFSPVPWRDTSSLRDRAREA